MTAQTPSDQPEADGADPAEEAPEPATTKVEKADGGRRSQGMTIALIGAVSLLVLALVAFILVSQRADDEPAAVGSPGSTVPADQLVEFDDPEFGINLKYPSAWTRLDVATSSNRRLVLQESGNNGMWVSALGIPTDVADLKAFARETILQGSTGLEIAADPEITLNGVRGFYFLYTFLDDTTGLRAAHAHYFLLRDGEMLALVFQAAPASDFERLASTFDQIADSVMLTPPRVTSTTAPATTSTTAP